MHSIGVLNLSVLRQVRGSRHSPRLEWVLGRGSQALHVDDIDLNWAERREGEPAAFVMHVTKMHSV